MQGRDFVERNAGLQIFTDGQPADENKQFPFGYDK